MRFQTAKNWMIRAGKKITAPGFIGYWFWDTERKEVIIVTKNNVHIPMSQSDDWEFTLDFICSDEWEIYNGPDDPRESTKYAEVYGDGGLKFVFDTLPDSNNCYCFSSRPHWGKALKVNQGKFNLISVSNLALKIGEDRKYENYVLSDDLRIRQIYIIVDGIPTYIDVESDDRIKSDSSHVDGHNYLHHKVRITLGMGLTTTVQLRVNLLNGEAELSAENRPPFLHDSVLIGGHFEPKYYPKSITDGPDIDRLK